MTRTRLTALVAAALLAAACSRENPSEAASADSAEVESVVSLIKPPPAEVAAQAAAAADSAAGAAAKAGGRESRVQQAGEVDPDALGSSALTGEHGTRRFIRTVSADFQVQDVQRALARIEALAQRSGGFVTRSAVSSDVRATQRRPLGDGRLVELSVYVQRANLQVRVPSERAQAFVRGLAAEMDFLDRREYRAVDAQFELLRQELARARHALAQRELAQAAQRGGRTGENVMAIEAAAAAGLARDEALLARRTFEDQVAFATIDLAMHQPERVRRSERPDVAAILDREGPGFFRRAGAAFAAGWTGLLEVALALAALWPLWLGVLVAVLAWRRWRRASLAWRRASREAGRDA